MTSEGFSLNIAASSSSDGASARPAKKRNTFRVKKNAKKAKAKRQAPQNTNKEQERNFTKPRPNNNNMEQKLTSKQVHLKPVEKTFEIKSEVNKYSSDASDSTQSPALKPLQPSKEMSEPSMEFMSDNDNKDNDSVLDHPKSNINTEDVDIKSTVTTVAEFPQKKIGSRKNPNKEAYIAEEFTKIRTDIGPVLEKPLESISSEQIFAKDSFDSLCLDSRLVQILKKDVANGGFEFERLTRVQVKSVPLIIKGRDVLIKSETGSGKTLSYLLPIVQKLVSIEPRVNRSDGCLALILAPTRELCQQILETTVKLTQKNFHYLVSTAVVGGEKKKSEKARLRKGVSILIATPGRLADHLVNTQSFDYSKLQFIVLDEADRLLDMGFEKQLTQILSILNEKKNPSLGRQNVLVSATINSEVEQLAKMSLVNPFLVDADDNEQNTATKNILTGLKKKQNENFHTPHQLMEHFMIVPAKARLCALSCFLRQEMLSKDKCKIVVFMSTCDAVDFHYTLFNQCTWPCDIGIHTSSLFGKKGQLFRLHGNISQKERTFTFKNFCSSSTGVLFCTDVAARGLNLPTVQWIVQYDPPTETRDYVHRVGRTARSGKEGSSLLFLMPSESQYLDYLKQHGLVLNALSLEKCMERVGSKSTCAEGGGSAFRSSKKKLFHEIVQSELQYLFEQTILANTDLFEIACQSFHSFIRSYATHSSDTRNIFHVRSLHFGHIAKSFALRDPPASTKIRTNGQNAKHGGTLQKRKEREEKQKQIQKKQMKLKQQHSRQLIQQVAEFAH
jgi:ATP-dependent RNA helicase DDX31/DBP7